MLTATALRSPAERGTLGQALLSHQTLMRQVAVVIGASLFIAVSARVRISLPIGPVPITAQTFSILLVGGLLGPWLGLASASLYIAEGMFGLPVYAGGHHGWAVITGSTGGYLVSYPFAALLVGWLAARGWDRRPLHLAAAMLLANVLIYTFGVLWLYAWGAAHLHVLHRDHMTWGLALRWGLLPFIPGDLAKLLLAASLVPAGWQLLYVVRLDGHATVPAEEAPATRLTPLALAAGVILAGAALLPWTGAHPGIDQGAGVMVLIAGLAGAGGAILRLRGTITVGVAQLWGFAAGALGGLVAFVHLVQFTKAGDLALADVSLGVPLAVLAALVLLASTAWDGDRSTVD